MKNNILFHRTPAFSILEVTVVIALMALLSALFFGALNRFNEQIANETKIKNELNNWYVVRSNLWRELDEADSVHVKENTALIWHNKTNVSYRIENDELVRTSGEIITPMQLEMTSIKQENRRGNAFIEFTVRWKNEDMVLSYPVKASATDRINTYFLAKRWPRQ